MCTLAVLLNVYPSYPLVVVANRDEEFGRPSAPPTFREGPVRVLSPTDLLRGGAWIAVNESPLFVGLTNRKGIPSVPGLRSRGELVADAAKAPTLDQALASVMGRDRAAYNGFHMIISDDEVTFLAVGNGSGQPDADGDVITPGFSFAPLHDGLNIATNLGLGAGTPRGNAIVHSWDALKTYGLPPPRATLFNRLLTWHDVEKPSSGTHGRRYDSICLHATPEEPDYGTVSSTFIRLEKPGAAPKAWQYWHGAREKVPTAQCSISWSSMMTLPVAA